MYMIIVATAFPLSIVWLLRRPYPCMCSEYQLLKIQLDFSQFKGVSPENRYVFLSINAY